MSRSRKLSFSSNSTFEKNFLVQNTFKRNRRYLNVQEINKTQALHETNRRRPFSSCQNSIDEKINNSFMNTTAALSDKVEQDIDKFKLRMSNVSGSDDLILEESRKSFGTWTSRSQRKINSQTAHSLDTKQLKKKIRGMALDKYCSREQYYQSKSKPVIDERLFNNYSEMQADLQHTRDFKKYMQRRSDLKNKNFNGLQYNTQKLYEDYYFKKTTMNCKISYKNQPKNQSRTLFSNKRKDDMPATQLTPEKVERAFRKCRPNMPANIQHFYANIGRQLPSQLDIRLNNNLTNQWVDHGGKILRNNKQYSLRKMKNELFAAKVQELQEKKRPIFERKQLCDAKYFRVHPIC